MKFLCDQMLAGLGKWLRTAGYDTEIVETPIEDRKILERALREGRLLLTRDHHFCEMPAGEKTVIFLEGNSIEECVLELNHLLKIDWLHAPFSRCLQCNSLLAEADAQVILEQVPADVRSFSDKFWYCPQCQKAYWKGSHTERMLKQLEAWKGTND